MYKVKRLVKTGEFNANGYKFEPESLKKALDKYIEEGGYLLKPYSDSYAESLEERGEILPEYIIGKIDNYDDDYIYVKEVDKDFEDMVKTEYIISDPQIRIEYQPEGEQTEQVLTETALDYLLFYLNNIPNGVQHYCQELPELPETSLNIGIIDSDDTKIHMCTSVRSSVKSRKEQLVEKLQDMAEAAQGTIRVKGEYPEWSFKSDSELRKTMQGIYHELYGEEMKVDVIHAGLECGYLLQKKPELDIISFGPQMYDIHTTEERLSIASTEKTYRFVRKLIENGID